MWRHAAAGRDVPEIDMTNSDATELDTASSENLELVGGGRRLLLVDDDAPLRRSMTRALERRGFQVLAAESLAEAKEHAHSIKPEFAVLDMRLAESSGLDLVHTLRTLRPDVRIVIVTGYGNIAAAVVAIKAGAVDYLAKPVDADDVVNALLRSDQGLPPPPDNPMSADRVRWEHIQRVFEQCNRNVSETARRLNMHRRTLQRILNKRAPRE
jgi:two-component system response regulator RegA